MEKLIRITAVTLFLCVCGMVAQPAFAQRATPCDPATPNNAICVMWDQVTLNTDGTLVTLPITYRVERQTLTPTPTWTTVETVSTLRSYVRNLAPGTYTFRVLAIVDAKESAPSNTASRSVDKPTPQAPVIQVVQVVIGMDHAPVYRITQNGKRDERYSDACGYIEVGKECSGPVLFRFREKSFRKVSADDVKAWGVNCSNAAAPCAS